jgi:hypothetical protein
MVVVYQRSLGNAAVARGPALAQIAALQQTAGNGAVARLLQGDTVAESEAADKEKSRRPVARRPGDHVVHATAAIKQGKASNAYGTFFYTITKNAHSNGCITRITFTAFSPEIDSAKITFIQTAHISKAGGACRVPKVRHMS